MMIASKLVIIGTGGFGREVLWAFNERSTSGHLSEDVYCIRDVAFVDDSEDTHGTRICNRPVIGTIEETKNINSEMVFVCGVGDNGVRKSFVCRVEKVFGKGRFYTIVHSSVEKSDYVSIGEGSIICAGSIVTTQVTIGNHVNINLDCTVGHDVVIEDFVNVSPGVHISGYCTLKEGCDIGTGANILPHVTIGKNSIVGAGACVTKDVPDDTTVVGVPAKVIKGPK